MPNLDYADFSTKHISSMDSAYFLPLVKDGVFRLMPELNETSLSFVKSLYMADDISIGRNSTCYPIDYWSIPCTIDGKDLTMNVVSKSIDEKKEVQVNTKIDNRPIHLFFHRNYMNDPLGNTMDKFDKLPHNIHLCESWSQLADLIKLNPKTICFHANELNYSSAIEIVNMVNTIRKLVNIEHEITVTVAVDDNTNYKTIKELQKSGVFGIIPNHFIFGWEEAVKGLHAQWANIPYWPKHILDQLPGSKKPNRKTLGEIHLTTRQQQILDLIKERGASNKTIAKTLNIAESTVKLHVGIVLKKYGVKNRTQLALFSKK